MAEVKLMTDAKKTADMGDVAADLAALKADVAKLTETLMAKYTAMDTLIAKINASSSSIMTTLNSLNNPKTS